MRIPSLSLFSLFFVFLLGVLFGSFHGETAQAEDHDSMYEHMRLFSEVLSRIENDYVEDISAPILIEGAIRGMVGELDPHSSFMDPEQYAEMQEGTEGEYVGIGVTIRLEERENGERIVFTRVHSGGPAADAGLREGDLLFSVDEEEATTWDMAQTVEHLRGQRGERVSIEVERLSNENEYLIERFELVRDRVVIDAVEEEMPVSGFGVIRVTSFQRNVGDDLRDAIDNLEVENGGELTGLVLDLRGNPGGLLSEGIDVADVFLSRGEIVSTMGRWEEDNRTWLAHRGNTRFTGPLVVLINEGTASASEIVAGALQDNERAVLIGTQSYGKGSVQSVTALFGGSGLKLTISLYYTPDGRSIQNRGISPDLTVADGVFEQPLITVLRESELENTLENPTEEEVDPLDDIQDRQLRFALQQLRALDVLLRQH